MHLIAIVEVLAQLFFIYHAIQNRKPRHWLFILLIPWIGFLLYVMIEILPSRQHPHGMADDQPIGRMDVAMGNAHCNIAYISQGKLFHKRQSSPPEQIQSHFGQKIIDQTIRMHQKNEWKTKGSGSHFGGSTLWGIDRLDTDAVRVAITSVTHNREENRLYYILSSETAGGLFAYDHKTDEEQRLFHKENFFAVDLDRNHETGELACAQQFANGTANIMVMNGDGSDLRAVTEGDSADDAPAWMPGSDRRLLFQSAGVARNKEGYAVGRGPTAIQALDLDQARMTTVLEDDRYDFLQPRIGADGNLYYIRRPYEMHHFSAVSAITDFVLFPFRLLRAVFHYLNFFSLVYSRKPLTTASGPKIQGDDLKTIMLKGRVIDAEKALRTESKIMGVPSLVPATWELVRRHQNGSETIVARHVAAYHIGADGVVIYSNGCGIFGLDRNDRQMLLHKDRLIENVIVG